VLATKIAHALPALLKNGEQCCHFRRITLPPLNSRSTDWFIPPINHLYASLKRMDLTGAIRKNNCEFIPNFGDRWRQGERISTGFVESTINQIVSRRFVKKQQMQWSLQGAHLLLQIRTRVLNNELEETFRQWYPRFRCQAA